MGFGLSINHLVSGQGGWCVLMVVLFGVQEGANAEIVGWLKRSVAGETEAVFLSVPPCLNASMDDNLRLILKNSACL